MPVQRSIAVTIIALFMSLTIFSCKSDSPTGPSSESIVGKWIVKNTHASVHATMGGTTINQDTTIVYTSNDNFMDLRADKSYSLNYDPYETFNDTGALFKIAKKEQSATGDEGTWSLSGSNLSLKSTAYDTTITMQISLSGNNLTVTTDSDFSETGISVKQNATINFQR